MRRARWSRRARSTAAPNELPPGDYKVVVKAGARDIVAPRVTIGLGQSVALRITMKNGQLVIE